MALADTKKVQTMINITVLQIQAVRNAITAMKTVRTTFQTINPSVIGTPLEGHTAEISAALNRLDTLVNTTDVATWDLIVAAYVPTHTGNAL